MFEIIEFEQEIDSELELVKKEADEIISSAKEKAAASIESEKKSLSDLDSEITKKYNEALEVEKRKILQEKEEKLNYIKNINNENIDKLVEFAIDQIVGS